MVAVLRYIEDYSYALTLFYEGEVIPRFYEGGDKFVLHPKNTKSLKKKRWKFA